MKITSKEVYLLAVVLAVFVAFLAFFGPTPEAEAEATSLKCTTSTITAVSIGNQLSTRVLATSTESRAFAIVQQSRDSLGVATSTVSLAFDEDVAATVANGITLSTSTPSFTFGINTDFPYMGAVHAITSAGSTTLRVTECLYPGA